MVVRLAVVVVVGRAVVVVEDTVVVVESVVVVADTSVVVVVSSACAGVAATHQKTPIPSTSAKMSIAGKGRANGVGRGTRLRAGAGREGIPRRIHRGLKRFSRPISPNTTFPRLLPLYRQGAGNTYAIPSVRASQKAPVPTAPPFGPGWLTGWAVPRHRQFTGRWCAKSNYRLYDLFAPEGWVNEDVFAYSNASGTERSLVLYNNAPRRAQGWIRESAAYAEKVRGGSGSPAPRWPRGSSSPRGMDGTRCSASTGRGSSHLSDSREIAERGLAVDLAPYGFQVFLDFSEVADDARGSWSRLCGRLAGQPVQSLGRALREMELAPVREAFRDTLAALRSPEPMPAIAAYARFVEAAAAAAGGTVRPGHLLARVRPGPPRDHGARPVEGAR